MTHDQEREKQSHPENFEWPEMRKWKVNLCNPKFKVIINATTAEEAIEIAETELDMVLKKNPDFLIKWQLQELMNIKGEKND